jgi:carboxypeptidase C (cathepsin A)
MRLFKVFLLFCASALVLSAPLAGQEAEARSDEAKKAAKPVPEPKAFVSSHTGQFGGETVAYTATAGETYLRDEEGKPKAAIFTFAYTKDGVNDPTTRPVTFVWNGGPGSSSVWLHMGAMGPRRIDVPSDASDAGPPPYDVEDNSLALLDVTDLVFVDPVGTGFSRAVGEHENKEFWGLNEDADSIAELIRTWVTQNKRWLSPKYLLGESFGTTRAGAVAARLEGRGYVSLNGLILVSQALDYMGSTPSHDNFISYITYLPTMAATAWYHGKIENRPESLQEFLDEARKFAVDDYALALLKGSGLEPAERERVRKRLAYFLGLSEDYIEQSDLRVLAGRFRKELLRSEGKAVGRLDGRYTGEDVDKVAERPDGDPASYQIDGAYAAALSHYIAAELGVEMDREYKFSGGRELGSNWNWRTVPLGSYWEPTPVNVARDLSRAMRRNEGLRVMIASGYYDYATPFFDAEYTFARHGFLPERISYYYYEAGHMMYLHRPSLDKLMADVRSFIKGESN